jgi:hypothetical protein
LTASGIDRYHRRLDRVRSQAHLDRSNTVPFYLLPSLGGKNTLRGYYDYRFHDRNMEVFNAAVGRSAAMSQPWQPDSIRQLHQKIDDGEQPPQ